LKALNNGNKPYKFPLIIALKADMPNNSDKNTDFCLGKLDL